MFVVFVIVVVLFLLLRGSGSSYAKLLSAGTPALGILLRVPTTGTRSRETISGTVVPFETRTVLISIEIPGEAPYEANLAVCFPANFADSVLPGATVELRLRKNQIAIVGPGAAFSNTFQQAVS